MSASVKQCMDYFGRVIAATVWDSVTNEVEHFNGYEVDAGSQESAEDDADGKEAIDDDGSTNQESHQNSMVQLSVENRQEGCCEDGTGGQMSGEVGCRHRRPGEWQPGDRDGDTGTVFGPHARHERERHKPMASGPTCLSHIGRWKRNEVLPHATTSIVGYNVWGDMIASHVSDVGARMLKGIGMARHCMQQRMNLGSSMRPQACVQSFDLADALMRGGHK